MRRLFRGFFIAWVVVRFGLDELFLNSFEKPWLRVLARVLSTVPAPRISPSQDPVRAQHIDNPRADAGDSWRTT